MLFFQVVAIYLGVGFIFALIFAVRGADSVLLQRAHVSGPARILLIPGAMLLWPIVIARWLRARRAS